MKTFRNILTVILLLSFSNAFSQEFVKRYEFLQNFTFDAKFTCLTYKNVMGVQQIFATGPFIDGNNGDNLIGIAQIDLNGNLVSDRLIAPDDPEVIYTPTGILYEAVPNVVSHVIEDVLTICGYYGTSATGNGFALRYNYTTSVMEWFNNLTDISAFFDIAFFDDDFLVCGHQSILLSTTPDVYAQEQVVLGLDKATGTLTNFNRERWSPIGTPDLGSSDSYYAMDLNQAIDTPIVLSSRITNVSGSRMKPGITTLDDGGASIDEQYFISAATSTSRLYGNDIAWSIAEDAFYTIISGDDNGSDLYEDDYIVKYPYLGGAMIGRKIDFTTDANDGYLNSIKLYTNGSGTIFPVIYGSRSDGTNLLDVYLFRLTSNLNTIGWSRTFTDIRCDRNTPNSLILIGSTAFAIGYTFVTDHNEPVLIRHHLTSASECAEDYEAELSTITQRDTPTMIFPERDVDVEAIEHDPLGLGVEENFICEEMRVAGLGIDMLESLSITNQSSQIVSFAVLNGLLDESYNIKVYNVAGQLVFENVLSAEDYISNYFENGVYVCRLFRGNTLITESKFLAM